MGGAGRRSHTGRGLCSAIKALARPSHCQARALACDCRPPQRQPQQRHQRGGARRQHRVELDPVHSRPLCALHALRWRQRGHAQVLHREARKGSGQAGRPQSLREERREGTCAHKEHATWLGKRRRHRRRCCWCLTSISGAASAVLLPKVLLVSRRLGKGRLPSASAPGPAPVAATSPGPPAAGEVEGVGEGGGSRRPPVLWAVASWPCGAGSCSQSRGCRWA